MFDEMQQNNFQLTQKLQDMNLEEIEKKQNEKQAYS